jgi:hypothetical protein
MVRPWVRWLSRIAIAIVVVAALVFPVVFPETTTTIATVIATKIRSLPTASVTAMVVEITVGAALVALAAIWWLWWRLPRRQVARLSLKIRDPKVRADAEDNFRKTVGQVLGGAAVLIGAGAAYLQFTQQQQASHDLLISNQVSKGFEQLAGQETLARARARDTCVHGAPAPSGRPLWRACRPRCAHPSCRHVRCHRG